MMFRLQTRVSSFPTSRPSKSSKRSSAGGLRILVRYGMSILYDFLWSIKAQSNLFVRPEAKAFSPH